MPTSTPTTGSLFLSDSTLESQSDAIETPAMPVELVGVVRNLDYTLLQDDFSQTSLSALWSKTGDVRTPGRPANRLDLHSSGGADALVSSVTSFQAFDVSITGRVVSRRLGALDEFDFVLRAITPANFGLRIRFNRDRVLLQVQKQNNVILEQQIKIVNRERFDLRLRYRDELFWAGCTKGNEEFSWLVEAVSAGTAEEVPFEYGLELVAGAPQLQAQASSFMPRPVVTATLDDGSRIECDSNSRSESQIAISLNAPRRASEDYTLSVWSPRRIGAVPYPNNQNAAGSAYADVAGLDMSQNLILLHFDETSGSPTESAQGLVVDDTTYITGSGTTTPGAVGQIGRARAVNVRGGYAIGPANGVLPSGNNFWTTHWEYQSGAIWPGSGFKGVFSRSQAGGSYITFGRLGGSGSWTGRVANSIPPAQASLVVSQQWTFVMTSWETSGPSSRLRIWEHHGLTDYLGVAVYDSGFIFPAMNFVGVFGGGTASPWIMLREYSLGGPASVYATAKVDEFALFQGNYPGDAVREAIYELQTIPEAEPYLDFERTVRAVPAASDLQRVVGARTGIVQSSLRLDRKNRPNKF